MTEQSHFGQCPLVGFTVDDLLIVEHRHARGMKELLRFFKKRESEMLNHCDREDLDCLYEMIEGQSMSRMAKLYFNDGSCLSIVQDMIVHDGEQTQVANDSYEVAIEAPGLSYGPHFLYREGVDRLISDLIGRVKADDIVGLDPHPGTAG